MHLDHINVHAEDLEAARDFLLAVLPLEQGFRPPFDFHGYWLYLDGKPIIHMQTRASGMGGRGWIDHLYLDPSWVGRGLGESFVDLARQRPPRGLQVWTFDANVAAQRFYERHGFQPVERPSGTGNAERAPDVRFDWNG